MKNLAQHFLHGGMILSAAAFHLDRGPGSSQELHLVRLEASRHSATAQQPSLAGTYSGPLPAQRRTVPFELVQFVLHLLGLLPKKPAAMDTFFQCSLSLSSHLAFRFNDILQVELRRAQCNKHNWRICHRKQTKNGFLDVARRSEISREHSPGETLNCMALSDFPHADWDDGFFGQAQLDGPT